MGSDFTFIEIIFHFRYVGLFLLLIGGLIGLPIPDEIVLAFSGYQIYLGKMDFALTILVAMTGSFLGMNLSYWIGRRIGPPVIKRIGPFFRLTKEKLARAEGWFFRYGSYFILFGYFLPGLRHLSAYFSGISKFDYRRFTLLATVGAFIWTMTFIGLGLYFGKKWYKISLVSRYYLVIGSIVIVIIGVCAYIYNQKKTRRGLENDKP